MRTQLRSILLLLGLFGLQFGSHAQRFEGAVVFGANFAELTGEDVSDFIGANAGLRGTVRLRENLRLGLELLFSQQGEYLLVKDFPNVPLTKVRLNYVEVPLQLDWRVVVKEEKSAWLNFGGAFAKLINYEIVARDQGDITELVSWQQETAMLITFGATAFFNEHIGLNFRGAQSLRSLQLSPVLSFRAMYRF
ncbi:MAG: outer membrane beta-barrel protein [Bacteroidota bacterium]